MSIDGLSTLMPYIPALRAESFHGALFEAIDADRNRTALDRMLGRLKEMLRVEEAVVNARQQAASEARTLRWSLSVGIASALAIPFGVIFGFFGVAAAEIDPAASMFDRRYWAIYGVVALTFLVIVCLHLSLYLRARKQN